MSEVENELEPQAVDTDNDQETDFLTGVPACSVDNPECESCQ